MELLGRIAQIALVLTWAIGLTLTGLLVGIRQDGLAAEIADQAMASPPARSELSQHIAREMRESTPIVRGVPGLDSLVAAGVETPVLQQPIRDLVEQGVNARLGHDTTPVLIRPNDLITSTNPLLEFGIQALPAVAVPPVSLAPALAVTIVQFAAPFALIAAIAGYLLIHRSYGRARPALLTSMGSMLAVVGLVVLPYVAQLDGTLTSLAVQALIRAPVVIAIATGGALIGVLGLLLSREPAVVTI